MNGFLRWLDDFSRASSFQDERGRMQARFVIVGSLLGGMRAITWTQVVQCIVFLTAYLVPVTMLLGYDDTPSSPKTCAPKPLPPCKLCAIWAWVWACSRAIRPQP